MLFIHKNVLMIYLLTTDYRISDDIDRLVEESVVDTIVEASVVDTIVEASVIESLSLSTSKIL